MSITSLETTFGSEGKAFRNEERLDRSEGKAFSSEEKTDRSEGKAFPNEVSLDRSEGRFDRSEGTIDRSAEINDRSLVDAVCARFQPSPARLISPSCHNRPSGTPIL